MRKALMAGGGVNASGFTGGRSLVSESLGRQISRKGFWVGVLKGIRGKKIVDYKTLRKHLQKRGMNGTDIGVIASIVVSNKDKLIEKV